MRYERFLKNDLHTHTALCNGKDTHEQMVLAAIGRGMRSIGFSEHSRISFDPKNGMTEESERLYRGELVRLRALYGDRIDIFHGIEQDFYSDLPPLGYDYVIGSVHYVRVDGVYCPVISSNEMIRKTVKRYFGGDIFRFLRLYFETVAELPQRTACDVVGHFDLIANCNADGALFDETDLYYRRYALEAIDALLDRDMIFEVNTKAFANGRRRTPNPIPYFLLYIAQRRGRVVLASDASSKEELAGEFAAAAHICRAVGLGSIAYFTKNGWQSASL